MVVIEVNHTIANKKIDEEILDGSKYYNKNNKKHLHNRSKKEKIGKKLGKRCQVQVTNTKHKQ